MENFYTPKKINYAVSVCKRTLELEIQSLTFAVSLVFQRINLKDELANKLHSKRIEDDLEQLASVLFLNTSPSGVSM